MTSAINKYARTMMLLFAATVLAIIAVLFTTGGLRIAAVAVLILLIMAVAAVAGAEITRQRRANLED
jgi:hypothetical protein